MLARCTLALVCLAVCALAAVAAPSASGHRVAKDVHRDLRYGGSEEMLLDVHRPPGRRADPAPAVLMVHGGAWRAGDKRRMEPVARAIARAGFVTVSVNYTLATRRRAGFPLQLRQLRAAVRWVRRHATRLGVDRRRIGALGISAGGHLAALLALDGPGPLSAGDRVAAAATWSAPLDLGPLRDHTLAPAVDTFLGCTGRPCPSPRVAAASPTTHASGDDPPMLLVSSRRELVPIGQARRMAAALASADVPHRLQVLPGSEHGRVYADRAIAPTIAFLRRQLR
jgi:acetyl esterase/lipase